LFYLIKKIKYALMADEKAALVAASKRGAIGAKENRMKKIFKLILWPFRIILTIILILLISAIGLSAILAGVLEKIIRRYKRFVVGILIIFRDEILEKNKESIGTINEKVKPSETIIAVLKNVKTGEKKVIRERWYHKILELLR